MDLDAAQEERIASIIDEFTAAIRLGKQPSIEEYQSRHPELAEEIQEVLTSVAMIEQLKPASQITNGPTLSLLSVDSISTLEQIGPYKILREAGRGGMGIVYEAVHETLGRKVAIKVLPTPLVDSQTYIERFRVEAQAAARLHHTNIISVFGAGEGPGYHYYVMDFVDGQSLNLVIGQMRNSLATTVATSPHTADNCPNQYVLSSDKTRFRWAARLAAQLADALSQSHAESILHRDIKPANMILDKSGRIWLTDFGLAKDISRDHSLTKTGDVVGTPQYLPPESLELRYDVRSETYGIGLVLYEMIALQPAYTGSSPAELIRAIASRTPTSIRKLVSDTPLDLAIIVEKSIAREPSQRYQSAGDLLRDLVAYLEDRPINARQPAFWETGYRWAKHNPLLAGLSASSALLLVLVAVSASVGYLLTTTALKNEARISASLREQQVQTEKARQEAEQNLLAMKLQFDRAESNVELSIEAFDEIFQHLVSRGNKGSVDQDIEGLREISGIETTLTAEDAKFLDELVKFYERFAILNAENEKLKAESAKAYRRVGNIYQIVGHLPPAIEAYEKSLKLLPALEGTGPEWEKEHLLTQARLQNELSTAHRMNGSFLLAQEWNQKSIQLLEGSSLSQSDPEVRLELARTMSALGFDVLRALSGSVRPFAIGKRMWERVNSVLVSDAIKILDQLIEEDPANGDFIAVRASCYWCMAAADLPRDQANGFENRNKAINELDTIVKQHPDNAEYQYLLALACSLTAINSDENPEILAAEQRLLERGVNITAALLEQHPNELNYHHLHAKLRIKLAGYSIDQEQRDQAFEQLRLARNSIQVLRSRAASARAFHLTIGALLTELSQLQTLYREAGNLRVANEVGLIIRQINQSRR